MKIYELIQRSIYGNYAAKSAIEVALVDLLAKTQKKTFSELIGIKRREEIPIIWRIAGAKNETDEAKKMKDHGFSAFKIKVGANTIAEDLSRAENLRREHWVNISNLQQMRMPDIHQKMLLDLCSKIDSAVLDYMEQPVNGYDVETMKKCNSLMDIPLSADEEYTHNQILFFTKKWMQLMVRV